MRSVSCEAIFRHSFGTFPHTSPWKSPITHKSPLHGGRSASVLRVVPRSSSNGSSPQQLPAEQRVRLLEKDIIIKDLEIQKITAEKERDVANALKERDVAKMERDMILLQAQLKHVSTAVAQMRGLLHTCGVIELAEEKIRANLPKLLTETDRRAIWKSALNAPAFESWYNVLKKCIPTPSNKATKKDVLVERIAHDISTMYRRLSEDIHNEPTCRMAVIIDENRVGKQAAGIVACIADQLHINREFVLSTWNGGRQREEEPDGNVARQCR